MINTTYRAKPQQQSVTIPQVSESLPPLGAGASNEGGEETKVSHQGLVPPFIRMSDENPLRKLDLLITRRDWDPRKPDYNQMKGGCQGFHLVVVQLSGIPNLSSYLRSSFHWITHPNGSGGLYLSTSRTAPTAFWSPNPQPPPPFRSQADPSDDPPRGRPLYPHAAVGPIRDVGRAVFGGVLCPG